jgi:hypothetical protein
VGVGHTDSSFAAPDQGDGHEPRPSVTIRQRSRPGAVVGLAVGPATTPSPVRAERLRTRLRNWRDGRCAIGLRNRLRILPGRDAWSGCAVGPQGLRSSGAQVGMARCAGARCGLGCCRLRIVAGRWRAARGCSGALARRGRRAWIAPRCPALHRTAGRGRGRGRCDQGPDHGVRVPIVTLVGAWWSVVGSGSAGFLKVSNHTS